MSVKLKNSKTLPKRYFGLHMVPGCAEYHPDDKPAYKVFVNEDTIKKMDPTFEGRPVYVQHVDKVDLDKLQEEADGFVVKSFYNAVDGKHWVEFLVVSDEGKEAIANGWRLSNCYHATAFEPGGTWNGMDYQKEVVNGEYEHLAIVQNPRYDESIILSPEQFKKYNEDKQAELKRLSNSKGEKKVKFNFFKKEKVENAADLEAINVHLPNSKEDVTVAEAISRADKFTNMHGYANGDHMVKVGDKEMSVNELTDAYCKMKSSMEEKEEEKKNEDKKEEPKNEDKDEKEVVKEKQNTDEEKDKQNEGDEDDDKEKNELENFRKLKNAEEKSRVENADTDPDLGLLARGRQRYGSGN